MDSAPAVAAELWRPPHLGAGGGRAVEATSAITEKSSGGRGGGGAGRRKQREAPASEDDSSRIVSTSGGGGQDLVSGKASVLDEIINYIQSLQCQVEFLSMKLEAVNAHANNGVEAFPSKDFAAPTYSTAPGLTFDTQTPREYAQGASTSEWLHMQIGNGAYGRVS
nr:unnamed protein product [Digitaria exilis]